MDNNSLAHTKWNCKYHIVFTPKYRRQVIYKQISADIEMCIRDRYGVAQCRNGRVANTCNLSEDWVGYSTRYGDAAGDFSPLSHLTVQEVRAVGRALGLPDRFVDKTPIDGLCGKTDEENLGFTYAVLDRYIRLSLIHIYQIAVIIFTNVLSGRKSLANDGILHLAVFHLTALLHKPGDYAGIFVAALGIAFDFSNLFRNEPAVFHI